MKTEKISRKSDQKNLIEEIKKVQKIEPAKEFSKQYEEQLTKKQEQQEKEKNNTENQKSKKEITPQEAYEMQKTNAMSNRIIKTEKEKVREFKKGYARYEQHLEDVANMQEKKYQEKHGKEQDNEHEEK